MMKVGTGGGSPGEPSNRDLCHLVKELMEFLLPADEGYQIIRDLITRFGALGLSSHEFTCLKFLAIFNPYKHGQSQPFVLLILSVKVHHRANIV